MPLHGILTVPGTVWGRAMSDRVAGIYRAGSDHRKDGAAVGW